MKTVKVTLGGAAALWALAALLTIPKCLHHLYDATYGPFMQGLLVAALSSAAAGIVLTTFLFRSVFRKSA